MKRIASADNPRFKSLLKLAESSRERKKLGLSLLDGVHLVAAYREHVGVPEQLVISDTGATLEEVRSLVDTMAPLAPLVLSDQLFHQLSTVATPTGVLAAVNTPRPPVAPEHLDTCVMLEDIQDPGNLGSILRSAAAAGIEHVFLSHTSVHAWSPRVLRAGMGAHFMVRIYEQCDLIALVRAFKGRVIGTSQRAKKPVFDADLSGRVAFLFGNEGAGLSAELTAVAHELVCIPMPGAAESLNIAAATAVCLFERVRQQHAAPRRQ
ncbi:MAG: tRNA/rRNA methyltransferase SpoU [Betaproteobacteria bacterium]|nr:tRNA/rRNA methyltransferase SpoU [Betaproteobacteria bacterium]